jgi:hypothetical protein
MLALIILFAMSALAQQTVCETVFPGSKLVFSKAILEIGAHPVIGFIVSDKFFSGMSCNYVSGCSPALINCTGTLPSNTNITGINVFAIVATLYVGPGQTTNATLVNDCGNPSIRGAGWNAAWAPTGLNQLTLWNMEQTVVGYLRITYATAYQGSQCPTGDKRKPIYKPSMTPF